MIERLHNPDMEKASEFESRTFDASDFESRASYHTKDFEGTGDAKTKTFDVLEFLGLKKARIGQEAAEVRKTMDVESAADASKTFESEAFTVKRATPAHKTAAAADDTFLLADKEADPNPAVQGTVDQIAEGLKENLSIGEIRELLNKEVEGQP